MKKQNGKVVCDVCGKAGARVLHVAETHGKGKRLLVMENIPMVSCPHCGESYFTADTLHHIGRIKLHRKALAAPRPVAVAEFA
jgi:YgiT-type zinc finger domain-containing protein